MIRDIADKLIALSTKQGWEYKIRGRDISVQEAFADFGVLPGMLKRADKMVSLCTGQSIGITYNDDEKTLLGYRAEVKTDLSEFVLMLYLLEVLVSIVDASTQSGRIAMDQLTYE